MSRNGVGERLQQRGNRIASRYDSDFAGAAAEEEVAGAGEGAAVDAGAAGVAPSPEVPAAAGAASAVPAFPSLPAAAGGFAEE